MANSSTPSPTLTDDHKIADSQHAHQGDSESDGGAETSAESDNGTVSDGTTVGPMQVRLVTHLRTNHVRGLFLYDADTRQHPLLP
jgi:hypothetical protein